MKKYLIALTISLAAQNVHASDETKKREVLEHVCDAARGKNSASDLVEYEKSGGDPNKLVAGPDEDLIEQAKTELKQQENDLQKWSSVYEQWFKKPFEAKACAGRN